MSINQKHDYKKFRCSFLLLCCIFALLLSLFMVSCNQRISDDVIGLYFVIDTQEQSVIAVRHYDTKEEAMQYYQSQSVKKYYIFATKMKNAQVMFDSMEGDRDVDGCINIILTDFDGTTNGPDSIKAFINKYKLVNIPLQ